MTRMPRIIETARKLVNKEPHKGVNPDEVVAVGAAIQGGVLKGDVKDVLLLDVTPLTLAIETAGSVATPMITRNTTGPDQEDPDFLHLLGQSARRSRSRCSRASVRWPATTSSWAPSISTVSRPPRAVSRRSKSPSSTSMPTASSMFRPRAQPGSGKEQKISITGSSGLSKDEIDKMTRDAEAHAEEDKKAKEKIELRNNADSAAYAAEKMLRDLGDKVDAAKKTEIEEEVKKVREALTKDDADAIKAAAESS